MNDSLHTTVTMNNVERYLMDDNCKAEDISIFLGYCFYGYLTCRLYLLRLIAHRTTT